jgi:hypothetical protein
MRTSKKSIWDLFERVNATELGRNLFEIIRSTNKYIHLSTKAKRSEILFGENAGHQYMIEADLQFQKRINSLKALKKNFKEIHENLADDKEKKISALINDGVLYKYTLNTKKMYMLEFLDSKMTTAETKEAMIALNNVVSTVEKFKKTEDVVYYLYQHVDRQLAWELPEDLAYRICLAILAITSLLLVVEISALWVCLGLKLEGESVDCIEIHRLMGLYFCGLRDSYLPD